MCHACGGSSLQLVYVLLKSQSFTVLEEYTVQMRGTYMYIHAVRNECSYTCILIIEVGGQVRLVP